MLSNALWNLFFLGLQSTLAGFVGMVLMPLDALVFALYEHERPSADSPPRPLVLDVDEDPVKHSSENKILEKANDVERPRRYEKPRLLQRLVPGSEGSAHQDAAEEGKQHTGYRDEQRLPTRPAYQGTPRVRAEIRRPKTLGPRHPLPGAG